MISAKDKEDQRKYYLSHTKVLVLDMKWKSLDINVVELTKIPQLSKADDILMLLRLPELFFDDVLVGMTAGYTTSYSHRERADISFEITNEKIRLFVSMPLLSGCHKPPGRKMY